MLDRDRILSVTNAGLDVFRHFVAGNWVVKRKFLNPLYDDKNPSCSIYYCRKNKKYMMGDPGNTEYSGDCFDIVGKIYGLNSKVSADFMKIMSIINKELHLGFDESYNNSNSYTTVKAVEKPTKATKPTSRDESRSLVLPQHSTNNLSYSTKPFSKTELDFWGAYGIDEKILSRYNVASVANFKNVTEGGKSYSISTQPSEPIFGYIGVNEDDNFLKIYRPFSKLRFLYGGTMPEHYCFGLGMLPSRGDLLFITGGEKDVLSLASCGYYAICFNSETAHIPLNIIANLSSRFKHIVLLYDMDKTGQEYSAKHQQKLAEYGVLRMLLPISGDKRDKDISDYLKNGGCKTKIKQLLLELLKAKYQETISILRSCAISIDDPPIKSEVVVSINGVPLGSKSNLLCITGGEGSGKSNFVGAIIAGAISKSMQSIDTLGLEVTRSANAPVLLFDTEQSEAQLYKNSEVIHKRAMLEKRSRQFFPYSFSSLSREARLRTIVESMDYFYHYNGGELQMVVIDGVADLISGANNENESISLVEKLYRYAAIYNTCIVCVLHFVPNGLKLRGHLGSELQRKSAAIISIEKEQNSDVSLLKAIKVRDGSPLDVPIIQFAWDKELEMHTYAGTKSSKDSKERKRKIIISAAKRIFSRTPHIKRKNLVSELEYCLDVQDRTAKSYISFMSDEEIIINDPSDPTYYMLGNIIE